MSIHIYNSLARRKEEFISLKPAQVKMYVCGPTVYDSPHIGHARSAYIFDVVRRYLIYKGYKVTFVRNVTDVDDKIINKARNEFKGEDLNSAVAKVADKYLIAYHDALASLGLATSGADIIEPKASEYIGKMIEFIQGLIDKAAAYAVGADVYFDITKAKNYGKLSGQSLDKMDSGARVAPLENKRNPLDFALWKSAKVDEPSWDSPWGRGRPGWHIECSVMSSDILGDEFDIHGGGLDLIFPHHENEIAQSEGAGYKFARYWIHHGLLTINGQKMAKSLGNFITIDDFLATYKNADLLKLFFLSAHYSSPVDYTDEKIQEAKKAYERLSIMLNKVNKIFKNKSAEEKNKINKDSLIDSRFRYILARFENAMDDDFNTPQALAVLQGLITETNIIITEYDQLASKSVSEQQLYYSSYILMPKMLDILGLNIVGTSEMGEYLDEEVNALIEKRNHARQDNNFTLSDKIRKELEAQGVILEDTKQGTTWRRKL